MDTFFVTVSILFALVSFSLENQQLLRARNAHLPEELTDEQLHYLAALTNVSYTQELFDNLIIPRVVGTPGHAKVRAYIIKELEDLGWSIEVDEFKDNTPKFGELTFHNVIATLNPKANRFLSLACHYDSKFFDDNNDFVGATDSAVPCAMMINLAKVMKKELDEIKNQTDVSLKLIFFDGEEAFVQWGPKDSIYGARHLANKWDNSLKLTRDGETVTDLDRIDVLVLLDLIGIANPKFYCFFEETQRWYERMVDAEERLGALGLLDSYVVGPQQTYFHRRTSWSFVEDDHIPFLRRQVPVVHVIATPFPKVWHTPGDDRSVVDIDTVENINKIMRIFVAEYLHLLALDLTMDKTPHIEL